MSLSVKISNQYRSQVYTDFLSGNIVNRLDELCRSFSLQVLVDPSLRFPIALGDACEILIDGELVLTGYIEQISGSGNASKNKIEIKGRDKTCDFVDSHIDVINDFDGQTTLKGVIEQIITSIGADIDVIDMSSNVSTELFMTTVSEVMTDEYHPLSLNERFTQLLANKPFAPEQGESALAPEPGDLCFEYVSELAATKSVVLNSTPDGNIAIFRAGNETEKIDSQLINRIGDTSANNLMGYNFTYDNSKRYFTYIVKASQAISSKAFQISSEVDNPNVVFQGGAALDGMAGASRDSRRFVLVNTKTGDSVQQQARATWEKNARISKSRKYRCSVQGFRNSTGDIWEVNKIVKVIDDYARINAEFLVNSVTFNYGPDGPRTAIELVSKDSYQLDLEKMLFKSIKSGGSFENAFSLESTLEDQPTGDEDFEIQGPTRFSADDFTG